MNTTDLNKLKALAADIDQFIYDWDIYEYRNLVDDRAENIDMILNDLKTGNTNEYKDFLSSALEGTEEPEVKNTINKIIDKLQTI